VGAVQLADWDKVAELKAQVFADGQVQKEAALVELQNGTDQQGFAEEVAGVLRKQGISEQSMLLGDAAAVQTRTLIVDLAGKAHTAKKLAEWLQLPEDRVIDSTDPAYSDYIGSEGDIVIVLGPDVRLSTAAIGD
jgi:hypothetical protein